MTKVPEVIAEVADDVERTIYGSATRNGRRTRRVAILAVLLTVYLGWTWVNTDRITKSLDRLSTTVEVLARGQGVATDSLRAHREWIQKHESQSLERTRNTTRALRRVYRYLGRTDEFDGVE